MEITRIDRKNLYALTYDANRVVYQSYQTPIAYYDGTTLYYSTERYSTITTKHTAIIRRKYYGRPEKAVSHDGLVALLIQTFGTESRALGPRYRRFY